MRYSLLFLSLLMTPMVFAQTPPITLIANGSVSLSAPLSVVSIKKIYLLKQQHWSDNSPIIVISRRSTQATRKIFEHKLGLSSTKYALYLKKMHYKGVSLPIIQESRQAVLTFVDKVPGSIAYIAGKPSSEMKNIKIIGLLR